MAMEREINYYFSKLMKLEYENNEIMITSTTNPNLLKYHFKKLYYAIMIKKCNRYSSISNKQRIDVVMTDDNLKILYIKRNMHENTFIEEKNATTTILLPLGTFKNLKIGDYLHLKEIPSESLYEKK
ncbi:MAG: hypothetical protein PUD25_01840 [Bacilli bacterium]|nr:hypothetical protein [Bacilli bacterium]